MKLPRRQFLHVAAGVAALPAVSLVAWAQACPTRPVRIIVGFAPGGAADIMARLIGQWLSERLGQPFVIENRPGAGSNLGTEVVVNAPSDGYTLLLVGSPNAINATLYNKLNFNFIRDITPVADGKVVATTPFWPRPTFAGSGYAFATTSRARPWSSADVRLSRPMRSHTFGFAPVAPACQVEAPRPAATRQSYSNRFSYTRNAAAPHKSYRKQG